MKQLYWSKVQEAIFYKGRAYAYTYHARMIYADNVSTSSKSIKDFEEFAALHHLRNTAEQKGKITIFMDDMCEHTLKKEYFHGVVITTFITPVADSYDFSSIMKELNYKDFIEFVKDNEIVLGGGKWK